MKSLAILHLFSCPEGKFQVPLISKSPPGEIWAPQITSSAFVHKLTTFYNYTKIYNGWVREKKRMTDCRKPMPTPNASNVITSIGGWHRFSTI